MKPSALSVMKGILVLSTFLGAAQVASDSSRVPAMDGSRALAKMRLAESLYAAKEYSKALKLYGALSDWADGEGAAEIGRNQRSLIHYRNGYCLLRRVKGPAPDYDTPIAEFMKAIGLDPGVEAYYSGLADAFERKGDWSSAERAYAKSLSLKPDDAASSRRLGIVLLKEGRSREALAQAEKTLDLRPGDPVLMMDIARCHAALKNKGQARNWIVKAVLAGYKTTPGSWDLNTYFLSVFTAGEMDELLERKS